jgi:hypothetical protein
MGKGGGEGGEGGGSQWEWIKFLLAKPDFYLQVVICTLVYNHYKYI